MQKVLYQTHISWGGALQALHTHSIGHFKEMPPKVILPSPETEMKAKEKHQSEVENSKYIFLFYYLQSKICEIKVILMMKKASPLPLRQFAPFS